MLVFELRQPLHVRVAQLLEGEIPDCRGGYRFLGQRTAHSESSIAAWTFVISRAKCSSSGSNLRSFDRPSQASSREPMRGMTALDCAALSRSRSVRVSFMRAASRKGKSTLLQPCLE